jgi:hypothetical protein
MMMVTMMMEVTKDNMVKEAGTTTTTTRITTGAWTMVGNRPDVDAVEASDDARSSWGMKPLSKLAKEPGIAGCFLLVAPQP